MGFFQLFEKDVSGLRAETARAAAEDFAAMLRLAEHRKRPEIVAVAEQMSQRINDRSHQIGATANRFRQDDVGLPVGAQLGRRVDEIIKLAAEAGPRHFAYVESLGPERVGVNQAVGLIVGHEPHAQTLIGVMPSEPGNGGRLAGTEETTDHKEACAMHSFCCKGMERDLDLSVIRSQLQGTTDH